jgi:hypothetical protein
MSKFTAISLDPDRRYDPPDEVLDEHPEEDWYQCACGLWIPREEATERMSDYENCEDCDSDSFD